MKSKTNITRKQVDRLLDKVTTKPTLLSDLGEKELYIFLRAAVNELMNMCSDLSLVQVLRANAECIIDD